MDHEETDKLARSVQSGFRRIHNLHSDESLEYNKLPIPRRMIGIFKLLGGLHVRNFYQEQTFRRLGKEKTENPQGLDYWRSEVMELSSTDEGRIIHDLACKEGSTLVAQCHALDVNRPNVHKIIR